MATVSEPAADAPLGAWAVWYASNGWRVFRLAPGSKKPLKGSHSFKDATTDVEQVRKWWAEMPNANIGAATGDDFLVFDTDPRNGSAASMETLKAEGYELPEPTLTAKTPGGGLHRYLSCPGAGFQSQAPITVAGVERKGCDVKCDGGYVLLPPSTRKDGAYEWVGEPRRDRMRLIPLWLLRALPEVGQKEPAAHGSAPARLDPARIPAGFIGEAAKLLAPIYVQGRRTLTAFALSGALGLRGVPQETVEMILQTVDPDHPHLEKVGETYRALAAGGKVAYKEWIGGFETAGAAIRAIMRMIRAPRRARVNAREALRGASPYAWRNPDTGEVFEPMTRVLLPDGTRAIEILKDGAPTFLVRAPSGEISTAAQILLRESNRTKTYAVPVAGHMLDVGAVALADGVDDYGSVEALYEDIQKFLQEWVDLSERAYMWLPVFVLTWYMQERCSSLPILNFRGPPGTGKTRAGGVVTSIAPFGLRGSATMSYTTLFREADKWKAALFINECDIKPDRKAPAESEDIVKWLNERVDSTGYVARFNINTGETQAFKAFGPTTVTTRGPFPDDALEDRCFTFDVTETAREDIKLNYDETFDAAAAALRRKLLRFYFDHIDTFEVDPTLRFPGASARTSQLLQPLASLCREVAPNLYARLTEFAEQVAAEQRENRATHPDGLVVRAWSHVAYHSGEEDCAPQKIVDAIKSEFSPDTRMTAKSIGGRMRALGFVVDFTKGKDHSRYYRPRDDRVRDYLRRYLLPEELDREQKTVADASPDEPPKALNLPILEALKTADDRTRTTGDLQATLKLPFTDGARLQRALEALAENGAIVRAGDHIWRLP